MGILLAALDDDGGQKNVVCHPMESGVKSAPKRITAPVFHAIFIECRFPAATEDKKPPVRKVASTRTRDYALGSRSSLKLDT
jgi:hypothetical protein